MPYWEPFEEIERLHRRLHRLMSRIWEPISEEMLEPITARMESFPVDLAETEDELIIKADLPGFSKEEVAVKATENTIEIAAQHREKKIERTERIFRAERKFGALRRFLTLPIEVKPETAKAKMENGVLEIRFKKAKPGKKAREIKIE